MVGIEKRGQDPLSKRRRALYAWVISQFMVESPSTDLETLHLAAREVWKHNHNKVVYLASVNELFFVIAQVYTRKLREVRKPLAVVPDNVISLSDRRGPPNGR